MVSIKKTKRTDSPLTLFTVSGVLSCEETIHALEDFYKHGGSPNLLWDFTDADLFGITQKEMEQIITFAKSNAALGENGKTAFVVSQDLSFGLSRMYETQTEIWGHPIPQRDFRDMDKAISWLETGELECT
ncbi:MAG: hypothetical protein JXK94_00815 [Deltaproteobacteria bacterium]|nr:hypothetical protein [Deltaproteobacteria bacterium]